MLSVTTSMVACCVLFLSFFGRVLVSATACSVGFAPCGDLCFDPGTGKVCCDKVSTSYICDTAALGPFSETSSLYITRTALISITTTLSLTSATSVGHTAIAVGANASVWTPGAAPVTSLDYPSIPVAGTLTSVAGTCPPITTTVYSYSYSYSTATVTSGPVWPSTYSAGNVTTGIDSSTSIAINSTSAPANGSDTIPVVSSPKLPVSSPTDVVPPAGSATPIPGTTTATSAAGTNLPTASQSVSPTSPVPSYDPSNAGGKPVTSALLSVMVIVASVMMVLT